MKKEKKTKHISFFIDESLEDDLQLLRAYGINRGNLVRKIIDNLPEEDLLKQTWSTDKTYQPKTKYKRVSKGYALSEDQWLKVRRLRAVNVPVYEMIRHGLRLYTSAPIESLQSDSDLLLKGEKDNHLAKKRKEEKNRERTELRQNINQTLGKALFNSLSMSDQDRLESIARKVAAGDFSARGKTKLETRAHVALEMGLTDEETDKVMDMAVRMHGVSPGPRAPQWAHEGAESAPAPFVPGAMPFQINELIDKAREAQIEKSKLDGDELQMQAMRTLKAKEAARRKLEGERAVPSNPHDLVAMRRYVEDTVKDRGGTAEEIETIWADYIKTTMKQSPLQPTAVEHLESAPTSAQVETTEFPESAPFPAPEKTTNQENGSDPAQPQASDPTAQAQDDKAEDALIYEIIRTELEAFKTRDPLTDDNLGEMFFTVRGKLLEQISAGRIKMSREECEDILTQTIYEIKQAYDMPHIKAVEDTDPDMLMWQNY